MCDVTRPHVDSFNWMLKEGLMKAASVRKEYRGIVLFTVFFNDFIDDPTIRIRNKYQTTCEIEICGKSK